MNTEELEDCIRRSENYFMEINRYSIDDIIFNSIQLLNTYKPAIDLIKKENVRYNENLPELAAKIRNADKDCAAKQLEIEKYRTENDLYARELKTLADENHSLELELSKLTEQKCCLWKRVKSAEKCKISEKDENVFKNTRLRAVLFKNILGVKFDLTHFDGITLEGYVFNRSYLKWFFYNISNCSEEELVQKFWNGILEGANIKDWPKLEY